MSDTETTTESETEAATEKRERRTFPIRLQVQTGENAWALVPGVDFSTIAAAETWITREGKEGVAYMMARIVGAKRRPASRLEEVAI